MTDPIRVLIVDDHPVVRQGLTGLLADEPGIRVVAQARNVAEACDQFAIAKPDVTLLDLRLPDGSGVDVIRRVRADSPTARFVVFTTYDADEDIYRAIEAGARGYLLKDTFGVELIEVIEAVAAGQRRIPDSIAARLAARVHAPELTGRETDVLALIAKGYSNKEIAGTLGIGEGTVKSHVVHILDKLEVRDRTGAVALALERGIIRLR
jgi:DNA-binding NarL/FixJ family response regulator